MFENLGFLKSKLSYLTISENRKVIFIKVEEEKNPRYPRHPRFRPGCLCPNILQQLFLHMYISEMQGYTGCNVMLALSVSLMAYI